MIVKKTDYKGSELTYCHTMAHHLTISPASLMESLSVATSSLSTLLTSEKINGSPEGRVVPMHIIRVLCVDSYWAAWLQSLQL